MTPKRQTRFLEIDRKNSLELLSESGCREARELLEYLNNLNLKHFNPLLDNMRKALEVARSLPKDTDHQVDLLNAISSQVIPFYKPTSGSVRTYP